MFFQTNEGDLNILTDSICSFMSFLAGNVIPTKQVRLYPNTRIDNKPWVTREMKHCLNLKKWHLYKETKNNNMSNWQGSWSTKPSWPSSNTKIRWRRGSPEEMRRRHGKVSTPWLAELRNQPRYSAQTQLNTFYSRFNRTDPTEDWTLTNTRYTPALINVEGQKVAFIFSKLHQKKPPGLDGIKGHILRECMAQLGGVGAQFFQLLLNASFPGHGRRQPTSLSPKSPMTKPWTISGLWHLPPSFANAWRGWSLGSLPPWWVRVWTRSSLPKRWNGELRMPT